MLVRQSRKARKSITTHGGKMEVLRQIIDQWGFVDSKQLEQLEKHFPDMPLIIRWGAMPREQRPASEVSELIAHVEEMNQDYVRDVFITSNNMDKLREALGVPNPASDHS